MRQKQFVVIVIVDCNAKGLKVMDRSNRGVQGVGPAHCVLGLAECGGGSGEIRTHGGLAPSPVFKTGALNRSATLPAKPVIIPHLRRI